MSSVEVGFTTEHSWTTLINGYREAAVIRIKVTELVADYIDPWTGTSVGAGVRFTMDDSTRPGTTYATLSLAEFRRAWVD